MHAEDHLTWMEVLDFSNKMQTGLFPWVQILIFPLYDLLLMGAHMP